MAVSPGQLRLYRAGAAFVAVLVSFGTVYGVCRLVGARADPAIMAAILAIGLSRRESPATRLRVLAAPFVAALVAVAAATVGALFRTQLLLGAVAFTAGMFASVWLRNFGERARTAGALLATPLVAMLVIPVRPAAPGGPAVDLALVIGAGVIPLAFVTVIQSLARRAGIPLVDAAPGGDAKGERRASGGMSPATRMALQMAVALGAAFGVGFIAFPGHWGWVVLTAFIVCSGARGRGDAAYTGVLRLAGALAGTIVAAVLAHVWAPAGVAEAIAIFVVLFFGLWLRDVNYAYWAACMTLILALLSGSGLGSHGSNEGQTLELLGQRLAAILGGALCAVAAAWFVLPIRTEAVVRRRIADALSALDELVAHLDGAESEHRSHLATFEYRITEVGRVAPPVVWHWRIFVRAPTPDHPARWIELVTGLSQHVRALGPPTRRDPARAGALRRAIGAARRALANHGNLDTDPPVLPVSASLEKLHDVLANAIIVR